MKEFIEGSRADIITYLDSRGCNPIQEFLEELSPNDRKKIGSLFRMFAELSEIKNTEKFRNEGDGIFVFKSFQVRVCCFFLSGREKKTLVLTNGFIKKQDKMPKREKQRAQSIRDAINKEKGY